MVIMWRIILPGNFIVYIFSLLADNLHSSDNLLTHHHTGESSTQLSRRRHEYSDEGVTLSLLS